uniref:Transcription elongation factor A2 n=1 Tax=Equus caballus TaxID=9796 RepID=A0A9L0SXN2_HORSE
MMGKEEEIARIARRLDKMVTKKSAEGALDLLRELKAMPVTLHLLQSTRVGMSVNALRKQSSDEEVIALAKSLIKSWKKLLDASDAKGRDRRRGGALPTSSTEACEAKEPSRKRPELPRTPSTPRITTFPPVPITCDAVRTKCREMLAAALQTDHDHMAIGADCERLSAQIEECIFRDVGNTDMKYKNRVRSRISNLKDAKNPELRRNVLCGAIAPQQIAVMTSEMASDELKEIRKAMTKEAIREHQMARTGGTQTDLFTCGKCRKKSCTYTQVQTRSSDEPMTTFVVCNECGNRWKVPQLHSLEASVSRLCGVCVVGSGIQASLLRASEVAGGDSSPASRPVGSCRLCSHPSHLVSCSSAEPSCTCACSPGPWPALAALPIDSFSGDPPSAGPGSPEAVRPAPTCLQHSFLPNY